MKVFSPSCFCFDSMPNKTWQGVSKKIDTMSSQLAERGKLNSRPSMKNWGCCPCAIESDVYRRPKYSAKAEVFYYLAFGFGHQSFILSIWPSALAESEITASVILCIELSCIVLPVNKKWKRILWTELRIDGEVYINNSELILNNLWVLYMGSLVHLRMQHASYW